MSAGLELLTIKDHNITQKRSEKKSKYTNIYIYLYIFIFLLYNSFFLDFY